MYMRLLLTICVLISFSMAAVGIGQAQDSNGYSLDQLAMQGRWIRTDAPYVVELRQSKNGTFQAAYFNPRPIHVEKTETEKRDGLHYIMILLQDVGYEGSVYLLSYNREQDALHGIYMHGASGQRFQVTFHRQTSP